MKRTHGLRKHPLYHVWHDMIRRCENPRAANYERYGARGVTVCAAWHDLETFYAWAVNGWASGLEIDRRDGSLG